MSVRRRVWTGSNGEHRAAWQVDYRDGAGVRRSKQFDRKKDAEKFAAVSAWEIGQGLHTADSVSITVANAAEKWLARGDRENLERSTLNVYEQHVRLHINPLIGAKKLNQLTQPMVEQFRDDMLDNGRSRAMTKRVVGSLYSIIKEAKRLGFVAKNVAEDVTVKRSGRDKPKVIPPTKEHMRRLIEAARASRPMDLPMLLVFLFAGLRASELRALKWSKVDLNTGKIVIDQRADFQNVIGPPKSEAGFRSIPIGPTVVTELRVWKLRCPPSAGDLVFPSRAGSPIFHANLVSGFQEPLQLAAGLSKPRVADGKAVLDDYGQLVMEGVYSLHDFRHAAASLWIEQRVDAKRVQTWMGHHSIQVTFDTYGHLFAAIADDAMIVAALESAVLNAVEFAHGATAS